MGWSNPIVGDCALHKFSKTYVNVVNTITTFIELTTPTTIITNDTILTQYSINRDLHYLYTEASL